MNIRDWVFDLDNTLYPAPALYDSIGERMTDYIARAVGVDCETALDLRERYFHRYGATMVGLVRHHGVDARDFLDHVHDVDCTLVAPDPELGALIAALPGRKFVFTNGGGGHGQRVLDQLGLAHLFDAVFDIEAADLHPKPQPKAYEILIAAHAIDPRAAMLIEDTPRNLIPAHALGFTTALVAQTQPDPLPDYVRYWAADAKSLLRAL